MTIPCDWGPAAECDYASRAARGVLLKDCDDNAPIFIVRVADLGLFTLAEQHHAIQGDTLVADVVVNLACTAKTEFAVLFRSAACISKSLNLDIGAFVCRVETI